RLSTVNPCLRIRCPRPPPSVRPPIPVWLMIPPVVASPNPWVARPNSPQSTPTAARAILSSGSTRIAFIMDRSIISPPSQTACPATEWPPPRTETSRSWFRAKRTASTTSSAPAQRAMSAGCRSIAPFQTRRASSYPSSAGRSKAPRNRPRSDSTALASIVRFSIVLIRPPPGSCRTGGEGHIQEVLESCGSRGLRRTMDPLEVLAPVHGELHVDEEAGNLLRHPDLDERSLHAVGRKLDVGQVRHTQSCADRPGCLGHRDVLRSEEKLDFVSGEVAP